MEEQRAAVQFLRGDELHATPTGQAFWQSVRRPRRGRVAALPAAESKGPYEASYSIQNGYPEREILLP